MPDLQSKDEYAFYRCGRCKGNIPYVRSEGRPIRCPQCDYKHGTRDESDVPSTIRLDLNNM